MSQSPVLDSKLASSALTESVVSVFADMVFIDAAPYPETPHPAVPGTQEEGLRIAIDVLKPLSLRLEFALPSSLVSLIAETLYAGEADRSTEEADTSSQDDSALELMNVIAGAFLSTYFGTGTAWKLELPFLLYDDADTTNLDIIRLRFSAEGIPFWVSLRSIRYRY